ncbi:MAG: hypothetical protein BroJett011_39870 [Chloroflexota bacterium]|nr:MAG: hypothetical protein BroJett011_39870 [Chloroflexota bacterium]
MKTFYTERDISDMHANGVTEIEIDDDVVMTDLARERAIALGLKMKLVAQRSGQPSGLPRLAVAPQMQLPPAVVGPSSPLPAPAAPPPPATESDLAAQVKSAVIARLGTNAHNDLLDQVIPQVLARLNQR